MRVCGRAVLFPQENCIDPDQKEEGTSPFITLRPQALGNTCMSTPSTYVIGRRATAGERTASRPQGSFSPILAHRIRQLTLVATISPTVGTETEQYVEAERQGPARPNRERDHGATALGVRRSVRDTQARRRIVGSGISPVLLHLPLGPPVGGLETCRVVDRKRERETERVCAVT